MLPTAIIEQIVEVKAKFNVFADNSEKEFEIMDKRLKRIGADTNGHLKGLSRHNGSKCLTFL